MKNINKLVNTILIAVSSVVAIIFAVGLLKQNHPEVTPTHKLDQSSFGNPDEVTNKYIKELQTKLKQDEQESIKQIRKAHTYKRWSKAKDEDWTKVPIEQQISRNEDLGTRAELQTSERQAAGASFGGTTINKDNAEEFIATARRNGYHVVLSNSYEVISITPIMNKEINDSFETSPAE